MVAWEAREASMEDGAEAVVEAERAAAARVVPAELVAAQGPSISSSLNACR